MRRARATVIDLRKDKKRGSPVAGDPGHGDRGSAAFPMKDDAHARNALARLPRAKFPLDVKQVVARRAANILQKVTPGAKRFGVTRRTRPRSQALKQRPVVIGRRGSRL